MKKILMLLALAALVALTCVGLVACGGGEEEGAKYKVTFYDADKTTVLKTEEVAEGGKATNWTPEDKADSEFLGWYATPDLAFEFDFDAAITKDTPVYSSWGSNAEDTRTWMIAGQFSSPDLKDNNWGEDGRLHPEKYAFEPVEGKTNTFTLTVDLYVGDVFQFGVFEYPETNGVYGREWLAQKGYGFITNKDEEFFIDKGNYLASSEYKHDIGVATSGEYKFTMTTDLYNDSIGGITWERLGDAPELTVTFTPTVMGTLNGYQNGTNASQEMYFASTEDPLVWTLEISLNRGELFFVLPFNNYNVQLNKDCVDYDNSDNLKENAANEIETLDSGKFLITLTIDEAAADDMTVANSKESYSVTAERIGDYVKGNGENVYTVTYRDADEGTNYTVWLKNGARFPNFTAPELDEGVLMGWHFVGTGENGENVGIANESAYKADGSTGTISYGVTKENERDTRAYWFKGQGGTVNGEELGSWNKQIYLNHPEGEENNHIYTATLVLTEEIRTMQICEDYLGVKTGTYYRGVHIEGFGTLDFIDATKANMANIAFSKTGVYELKLNTLTGRITVTRTGDVPATEE